MQDLVIDSSDPKPQIKLRNKQKLKQNCQKVSFKQGFQIEPTNEIPSGCARQAQVLNPRSNI